MKRGICTRKKQTISKALNSVLRAITLEISLLEDITLFYCFECTEVNKLNDFFCWICFLDFTRSDSLGFVMEYCFGI